jgi:hypothetical protein
LIANHQPPTTSGVRRRRSGGLVFAEGDLVDWCSPSPTTYNVFAIANHISYNVFAEGYHLWFHQRWSEANAKGGWSALCAVLERLNLRFFAHYEKV